MSTTSLPVKIGDIVRISSADDVFSLFRGQLGIVFEIHDDDRYSVTFGPEASGIFKGSQLQVLYPAPSALNLSANIVTPPASCQVTSSKPAPAEAYVTLEQARRLTIATAAMQGILTNDRLVNLVDRYNGGIEKGVVKLAVSITDKLIAEIDKQKGGDDAD